MADEPMDPKDLARNVDAVLADPPFSRKSNCALCGKSADEHKPCDEHEADGDACEEERLGLFCTRRKGHPLPHVAHGSDGIAVAVWPEHVRDDRLRAEVERLTRERDEALTLAGSRALALDSERLRADAAEARVEELRAGLYARMLDWRGIDPHADACRRCGGAGRRAYASSSTWRGGISGQVVTTDVCDACWGSGDATRPGANLRKRDAEKQRADDAEAKAAGLAAAVEGLLPYVYTGLGAESDRIRAKARAALTDAAPILAAHVEVAVAPVRAERDALAAALVCGATPYEHAPTHRCVYCDDEVTSAGSTAALDAVREEAWRKGWEAGRDAGVERLADMHRRLVAVTGHGDAANTLAGAINALRALVPPARQEVGRGS